MFHVSHVQLALVEYWTSKIQREIHLQHLGRIMSHLLLIRAELRDGRARLVSRQNLFSPVWNVSQLAQCCQGKIGETLCFVYSERDPQLHCKAPSSHLSLVGDLLRSFKRGAIFQREAVIQVYCNIRVA